MIQFAYIFYLKNLELCLFYFFSSCLFFSHILSPNHNFLSSTPPSPPPASPLPQISCSSISLQKRVGLPVISTERAVTRCTKTRHKPSYQDWMRQPRGREGSEKQIEESETFPLLQLGVPQTPQAKQPQHACRA